MNAPLPEPWHTGRDVANDYEQASAQHHNAVRSRDEMNIQFWNACHTNLHAEFAAFESSTVNYNMRVATTMMSSLSYVFLIMILNIYKINTQYYYIQ
jgi:hypothetical protein